MFDNCFYKEIIDALNGDISMEEAIYKIKLETRHFAKRQLTWFRREKDVIFLNKNEFNYEKEAILNYIKKCLIDKNIIEVR